MKILVCHNYYKMPGGEDRVFEQESQLLESHGERVERYTVHNDKIDRMNRLSLAAGTLWSRTEAARIRKVIRQTRPDVVHFHNTFPLISPSAYHASRLEGVPVVQTLHNYRLLCIAATLYRDQQVCQDCLGRSLPWPGVRHACYRGSRAQSAVAAGMLALHRSLGTWRKRVDKWIALTEFARQKFIEAGFPADRLAVKPNFAADPGPPDFSRKRPREGLFVGRLTEEKGLSTLVQACRGLDLQMKVIGDGPMASKLGRDSPPNVHWLGAGSARQVSEAMCSSAFLVVPSTWLEPFGLVIAEAFACGLPVIASRIGGMPELVEQGVTGRLFEPGNPNDLRANLKWMIENPGEQRKLGMAARRSYELHYSPWLNYPKLIGIYEQAIEAHVR